MAIVVVQVGQCGNQLGDELFTQLAISITSVRESRPNADSPFFCNDGMARCVLIDSEPKVVNGVYSRHSTFMRKDNVVCGQSGRGNNWGMGFHGLKETEESRMEGGGGGGGGGSSNTRRQGSAGQQQRPAAAFTKIYKAQRSEDEGLLTQALRAIHMETRRTADCPQGFEGIVLLHSLAGGTGSGLASRLAEKLRLYFVEPPPGGPALDQRREADMMLRDGLDGMLVEKRRARYLVSIPVAPQACGELSLQGINAALTLFTMHRHADATLLLRNDDVMAPAGSVTRSSTQTTNIIQRCLTFKEANEVLVALLMPVLQYGIMPSSTSRGGGDGGRGAPPTPSPQGIFATIVRNCCPAGDQEKVLRLTGGNKILSLLPTPQNTYETHKRAVLRCVFFTVSGGKRFLPGATAGIPIATMCARSVLQEAERRERGDGGRPPMVFTMDSPPHSRGGGGDGRQRQTRLFQQRGRPPHGSPPDALSPNRRPVQQRRMDGRTEEERDDRGRGNNNDPSYWGYAYGADENDDDDGRHKDNGGGESEESSEGDFYSERATVMPPKLLAYYQEMRRSPVAALSSSLEGVALLNQARELNRVLMCPLLASAAIKVKVGAFIYTYERAGVSAEFIVKAYRNVAEVLSLAEDL